MPTQAERSASARRRLMDAAVTLFATQGYRGTSVAEIGARAGQSRAAVNFHFGSKEALLMAIVRQVVDEWEENLLFPGLERAGTAEQILDAGLDAHRRMLQEQPTRFALYYSLMMEALAPSTPIREEMAALNRRVRDRAAELVRSAQNAGLARPDVDAGGLAVWLVGALRGIAHQYLVDPASVDLDAAYAELRRAVLTRTLPTTTP